MESMKRRICAFFRNEEGPTFIEYALLTVLIALVVVVAATAFGVSVKELFESVPNSP